MKPTRMDGPRRPDARSQVAASRVWRHLAPFVLLLGALGRPATAHAAGRGGLVRDFLAHTGHRVFVTLHRELGDLFEGLWTALWGETVGHASQRACAGLAMWDLAALALVAALVFAVVRVRNQTSRKRLEVARRMVEHGMEPPGDLLGDTTSGDLRRGVVLVFTGLGLLAASWAGITSGHGPPSSAGLIPGFIGLGYLASHWLTRRGKPDGSALDPWIRERSDDG